MRKLALAILTLGLATAGHAQAQRYDPAYPVCLYVVSFGTTPYYRCSYTTMNQCRASANGQMCASIRITLVRPRRSDGTSGVMIARSDQDRPRPLRPVHIRRLSGRSTGPHGTITSMNRIMALPRVTRRAKNNDFSIVRDERCSHTLVPTRWV